MYSNNKAETIKKIDKILERSSFNQNASDCYFEKEDITDYGFYSSTSYSQSLIETTPEKTGFLCGSIGSSYSMSIDGNTPVNNMIPGKHVSTDDINMQEFYYSESSDENKITVFNLGFFKYLINIFTLVDDNNIPYFTESMSLDECNIKIKEIIENENFFQNNIEKINSWDIKKSKETQGHINNKNYSSRLNYCLLLDIYPQVLKRDVQKSTSLFVQKDIGSGIPKIDTCLLENMKTKVFYPFSMVEFDNPKSKCKISKYVVSPFNPKDDKYSSMPLTNTMFKIENKTEEVVNLSLVFIGENLSGYHTRKANSGGQDSKYDIVKSAFSQKNKVASIETSDVNFQGVHMFSNSGKEVDFNGGSLIGVCTDSDDENLEVGIIPRIYTTKKDLVINQGLNSGVYHNYDVKYYSNFTGDELLSCAICVRIKLMPNEKKYVNFLQVFDFPYFKTNKKITQKKYVEYFEEYNRCLEIGKYYLENENELINNTINGIDDSYAVYKNKRVIKNLNKDIINKMFSHQYNILSTVLTTSIWAKDDEFYMKECPEYPFLNSLDVYFYGSFSLLHIFPKLDQSVIRNFAKAILAEDKTKIRYHIFNQNPTAPLPNETYEDYRSIEGAVIHDLGSIFNFMPNSYFWRNSNIWTDLSPKFVLMVYRSYVMTNNKDFLNDMMPVIHSTLKYANERFAFYKGLPINYNGDCCTYDEIELYGIDVYNSSLWIAAYKVISKIAEILKNDDLKKEFDEKILIADEWFNKILWDSEKGYYLCYSMPITEKLLNNIPNKLIKKLQKEGIIKDTNEETVIDQLNTYIYEFNLKGENRIDEIIKRKKDVYSLCGEYFNKQFSDSLWLDSDNVMADQLISQVYLNILKLDYTIPSEKQTQVLDNLMRVLFDKRNINTGIPNIVKYSIDDTEDYQAQEVWVGVQYGIVAALLLNDKVEEAEKLHNTLYNNIYNRLKIPFAEPEGIINNCFLHIDDIVEIVGSEVQAEEVIRFLNDTKVINSEGRIDFQENEFNLSDLSLCNEIEHRLKKYLQRLKLTYTVGGYLRPGMINSLNFLN